jgi:hypothetical protein
MLSISFGAGAIGAVARAAQRYRSVSAKMMQLLADRAP